jgi:hypothetical protein
MTKWSTGERLVFRYDRAAVPPNLTVGMISAPVVKSLACDTHVTRVTVPMGAARRHTADVYAEPLPRLAWLSRLAITANCRSSSTVTLALMSREPKRPWVLYCFGSCHLEAAIMMLELFRVS